MASVGEPRRSPAGVSALADAIMSDFSRGLLSHATRVVSVSPPAVKLHFGSSVPPSASIPKLDASNVPPVASQVDGSRRAPVRNSLSHGDFLRFTIGVVNHHPLELDRAAPHAELDRAKPSIPDTDGNIVVIAIPVYVRSAQAFPPAHALSKSGWRYRRQKQCYNSSERSLSAYTHNSPPGPV